jgi:hypothetical protein
MFDHQVLLLVTTVAVTRGMLPGHRAPTVAGGIELYRDLLLDTPVAVGIELDHQVLLLVTKVAVTRGRLNSCGSFRPC